MIKKYMQETLINYMIFYGYCFYPLTFLKKKDERDWSEIYLERCSGNTQDKKV
jgi:hypothetical protein